MDCNHSILISYLIELNTVRNVIYVVEKFKTRVSSLDQIEIADLFHDFRPTVWNGGYYSRHGEADQTVQMGYQVTNLRKYSRITASDLRDFFQDVFLLFIIFIIDLKEEKVRKHLLK